MILIVDDHLEIGMAMSRLLSRAGYHALHVLSAKEALQFLSTFDVDQPLLIVLDDMMPGMGGVELLTVLRMNPVTRHLNVVMFSAGCDSRRRDTAQSLGVAEWVVKGRDAATTISTFVRHYERAGGSKSELNADRLSSLPPGTYL